MSATLARDASRRRITAMGRVLLLAVAEACSMGSERRDAVPPAAAAAARASTTRDSSPVDTPQPGPVGRVTPAALTVTQSPPPRQAVRKGTHAPSQERTAVPATPSGGPLSVTAFLATGLPQGAKVKIHGACIDQFHARGSAGSPPVSRSDWQLATGTATVYVVGAVPPGCSTGEVTLAGVVATDSAMLGGERRVRRYLVLPRLP